MAVEMLVDSVHIDPLGQRRLVVLREPSAERFLPVAIGPAEAAAIALKLMETPVPRPLTHDLLGNVIRALGGGVQHILVHAVVDGIFYARVVLDVGGRHAEVDARPSDAIALAQRLSVPILVDEAVLATHAVVPEPPAPGGAARAEPEERVPVEQLAAFREVVEALDLDDLGSKP